MLDFDELYRQRLLKYLEASRSSQRFSDAIVYALDAPGKKIRPRFVHAVCSALQPVNNAWVDAALAVEMIHTYSLVHDDLPCMDNDDWRRGRLTLHRAFDESMAVLVGDTLLTDAFAVMASSETINSDQKVRLIQQLSLAAGGQGMVLGQALDMEWTGEDAISSAKLDQIHINKTGKLIGAAMAMGAICAQAPEHQVQHWYSLGLDVGLAFQIIDDLLDGYSGTGKSKGKDEHQQKQTYLRFYNPDEARAKAEALTAKALENCGDHAAPRALISELLARRR